jgi:hypothetical protein
MARGTLLEALPGGPVVLRLPDGTERRFVAADVAYAGPAESPRPAPASPSPGLVARSSGGRAAAPPAGASLVGRF